MDNLNIKDSHNPQDDADTSADARIIMENLLNVGTRISKSTNSVEAHLAELAYIAVNECATFEEILNLFSVVDEYNSNTKQQDFSKNSLDTVTKYARLSLFNMIGTALLGNNSAVLSDAMERILPYDEPVISSAEGKVAYFKNSQSDSAFLQFSSFLGKKNAKAVYFSSFSDICEEVYNGICEFCILPVENSTEGKLYGFCKIIRKYDLHIVSVCNVYTADRTGYTGFALLTKSNYRKLSELTQLAKDCFIEISVTPDIYPTLQDIISAAAFCGLELVSVDSTNMDEDAFVIDVRFISDNSDLITFLLFLAIDSPHCTVTGIFKSIKTNNYGRTKL